MPQHDIVRLLQDLLAIHSMQCSDTPRSIKNNITNLIFALFDGLYDKTPHIYENDKLYVYTKDSFDYLKKCNDVVLCCSDSPCCYTYGTRENGYKHLYEIQLNEGKYGINLNSFFENDLKIKKSNKKYYWCEGNVHFGEHEILVRLSDIEYHQELPTKE